MQQQKALSRYGECKQRWQNGFSINGHTEDAHERREAILKLVPKDHKCDKHKCDPSGVEPFPDSALCSPNHGRSDMVTHKGVMMQSVCWIYDWNQGVSWAKCLFDPLPPQSGLFCLICSCLMIGGPNWHRQCQVYNPKCGWRPNFILQSTSYTSYLYANSWHVLAIT